MKLNNSSTLKMLSKCSPGNLNQNNGSCFSDDSLIKISNQWNKENCKNYVDITMNIRQMYKKMISNDKKNVDDLNNCLNQKSPSKEYMESLINRVIIWNNENCENCINLNLSGNILWQELDRRLKNKCNTEWCWSKLPFVVKLRDNEIDNTFRPKMPKKWHQNPIEWLSTTDIEGVLFQYESKYPNFRFIGAVPIDFDDKDSVGKCLVSELCKTNLDTFIERNINKVGIVFNLDPSWKGGSHWVAMFIDLTMKNMYYWDSYGESPPNEVNDLANRLKEDGKKRNMNFTFHINSVRHQYKNTECGVYCIWFIVSLLESKNSENKYFELINNIIKDDKMQEFREKFFIKYV